jgi:hypothetical protein
MDITIIDKVEVYNVDITNSWEHLISHTVLK